MSALVFFSFLLAVAASTVTSKSSNFRVQYGDTPQPFTIKVNPEFEKSIRDRVAMTRYVSDDLDVPAFVDGPTVANGTAVGEYWTKSFNWTKTEQDINDAFQQFTTTVHVTETNYTDPVPLHFIHHRSPRRDASPLLFLHGWPESFLSIGPMIQYLTHPPNTSLPAFHVVAPSIPGFAFSPAPTSPGFGVHETAHAFNALMHQLSYPRYVRQAGDLGAVILRYQASLHPESVVSIMPNLWLEAPTADDTARFAANETTPEETAYFSELHFFATNAPHFYVQSITPLQAAFALTNSPLGLAMWIYQHMGSFSPHYIWSLDEIITWTMMFLFQGPTGAMRTYKEYTKQGAFVDGVAFGEPPYVDVPTGLTKRPEDVGYHVPVEWARRGANVTWVKAHTEGGHFAAYQDSGSLVEDIRAFFGDDVVSGTGEFRRAGHVAGEKRGRAARQWKA